ncbi:hypothetical protein K456DRAFT_1730679 [Colletotrichum gloeosporioides 23]|nr:hypothetical protein K456DRAFT_1730679 [Colletotrichum gloeosporioides 23]
MEDSDDRVNRWPLSLKDEQAAELDSLIVDLLRPLSKNGTVTLNSADPLEQAKINLNLFSNDLDLIAMREGVRFADDIVMNGEGMKDMIEGDCPWSMHRSSDKAMIKMIMERSQTVSCEWSPLPAEPLAFFPASTRVSSTANCKFCGVKGLRVIDATVISVIPDCRVQNAVYMVGEKGSDIIKAAYPELWHRV